MTDINTGSCRPTCAGWYIVKETGQVRACKACGFFSDDAKAAEAADRILGKHPPAVTPVVLADFACELCGVFPIPDFSIDHSNEAAEALGVVLCEACANKLAKAPAHWTAEQQLEDAKEDRERGHRCSTTCRGWGVFATSGRFDGDCHEIEMCGECEAFKSDNEAALVAIAFFESVLPGKRIARRANARTRARIAKYARLAL